jgi:molybdenum cofactor sulfurtransferase
LVRTGCLCNAGACQQYLGITDSDIRHFFAAGKVCGDNLGIIDGRPVGVVRVSFGLFSTLSDVEQWISLLQDEFLDCQIDALMSTTITASACEKGACPPAELHEPASFSVPPVFAVPPRMEVGPPDTCHSRAASNGVPGEIVALKVYPVKGCGALQVKRWPLDASTGALLLDRRWCVAPLPKHGRQQRLRPVSAKQAL